MAKEKMPLWKKIILGIVALVLVLVIAVGGIALALWHNELATLMSMKQVRARNDAHRDGAVYQMRVKGDFYLDDLIAQGGVESDSELVRFITGKITKGIIPMTIVEPEISCSSFTATDANGHKLFARNYDFSKTNTCVVFTEANKGRHATISTIDLQFLGIDVDKDVETLAQKITCLAAPFVPLDGINDAGVSCGIYMTMQGEKTVATDQNTDKPDMTSTILLRMILDYADDVDEAVEIAKKYDLHDSAGTSYHYMVADASGRSAVLEWVYGTDKTDNDGAKRELVVTYSDADDYIGEREAACDYQWVTNFILQPGYYSADSEKSGLDRYNRIYEELSVTDGVVQDKQAAMDILNVVSRRDWIAQTESITVHSVVYDLTDKTVLWIPNENYDDDSAIFEFALK